MVVDAEEEGAVVGMVFSPLSFFSRVSFFQCLSVVVVSHGHTHKIRIIKPIGVHFWPNQSKSGVRLISNFHSATRGRLKWAVI